jgi:hypothetical protein
LAKKGVNSTVPALSVLEIAAKGGIKFVNAKSLLEEMRIIKYDYIIIIEPDVVLTLN